MGFRELKNQIEKLLGEDDLPSVLASLRAIPGRQAVNPLFSLLYSGQAMLRWRAVTAMGVVVGQMADANMESARVVLRRLMWNLNDESGGIGWGSPEAMGEIAAVHAGVAKEFANIIVSYINPAGNFLEHETLQRGSLWAVGRLAHAHPLLAAPAAPFLPAFFDAADPYLRGTAVWAAGPLIDDDIRPLIAARLRDQAVLGLYRQTVLTRPTVAELAAAALSTTAQHNVAQPSNSKSAS
jgi:hypothetical protein